MARDSRVIGWQIDNEYNTISYSDNARAKFQHWLREQYGTLDKLNEAWVTSYWSEKYTDWSQIPLPAGVQGYNPHNPGLRLKWKQFGTESYRRFQLNQVEVIRANSMPAQWITHNFMGFFNGFDHYVMNEALDFASWDQYFPYRSSGFWARWRRPRPDARLQAQELLADGDAAGQCELGAGQQRAGQGRDARGGVECGGARRRCGAVPGNGAMR